MIKATSVQLASNTAVLAYVFQFDAAQWICLRSLTAGENSGWLECWSSKEGLTPDVAVALEAVRSIVGDHLIYGPLGPYIKGAHFIPGWNTWGGAVPAPIAQFRPREITASADGPMGLEEYLSQLGPEGGIRGPR